MSTDPVHLFLNPTAGRGRAGRRLARIEEILGGAGLELRLQKSAAVGDLETQVQQRIEEGARRIVVAGGDGSIHEAVNGIMNSNPEAALGVIPTGTGNDFAKAAQIPLDWEHATALLADRLSSGAPPRLIDTGRMNDRWFANGAGIGLDAKVTAIARSFHWPIGDLVYLVAIFRAMVDGITTPHMTISYDGVERQGPLTLVSISNGPWIGGMFHIAPMAKHADGQLELLIVDPVTRRRIVRLLPKLMSGKHMDEPEITHAAVRRVTVTAESPLQSHLDGEVQPLTDRFEIELLPETLRLV